VAAKDDPALEGEEQVLADGLDPLEAAAVDPLRNSESCCPRMRRLGSDHVSFENAEPLGGAVKRISLGHRAR
jgi:hypothetical protein